MSQQTRKKRSTTNRPNNANGMARSPQRTPVQPAPSVPAVSPLTALPPTSPAPSDQPEPASALTPATPKTSKTTQALSSSAGKARHEAHEALQRAQHQAQRAERLARLNEISPDMQQLLVATAGALLIGVLYLALPPKLIVGPSWLLLVLEVVLLAPPLAFALLWRHHLPHYIARSFALGLSFLLTAALVASVILLIANLSNSSLQGISLLKSGVLLWVCNVLVFAVWYWETDGGGPRVRILHEHQAKDFRFPQQEEGNPTGWAPGFVDYVFLAFCSATALSPADTMPLTQRAKLLTMAQAILSMVIIVLLVARSVNIL